MNNEFEPTRLQRQLSSQKLSTFDNHVCISDRTSDDIIC
eukprot:UN09115